MLRKTQVSKLSEKFLTGNTHSSKIKKTSVKSVNRRYFLRGIGTLGVGAFVASSASDLFGAGHSEPVKAKTFPVVPQSNLKSPSGKGKVLRINGEIKEYKDPRTGARVRRLTGDGSTNVHPYFSSWGFIGNNSENAIIVSNRSGAFQWYMLEIPASRLVQLTNGTNLSPNMACVARNGFLYYFDGPVLHSLKIDTLEDRELYSVPEGYRPALPTCSADGNYVAFAYCQDTKLSTETGKIYSSMHERYYQFPHSVVMRIDSGSGDALAGWGEQQWISHTLIHPTDPNIILFCHEGGSTCVKQRMWIIDLNDKQMRQASPLYPQKQGESCVHEYFTQNGEVGFQYSLDTEKGREEYNAFIRPDGTWIRQFQYPSERPGHIQSNSANSLVVGDGAKLNPEDKEGRKFIDLMTHENGTVKIRRLAWHGTSMLTQASHGHPSFSPDNKWVIYSSDAEKSNNVYMADVESI